MRLNKIFALLFVLASPHFVFAGVTGDIWSVGETDANSTGTTRVKQGGHLVPGQDNTYDLGTDTESFRNSNVQGTLTLGTLSTTSGTIRYLQVGSTLTYNSNNLTVEAATTVVVTAPVMVLDSTGSNLTMTGNPIISTANAIRFQTVVLVSTQSAAIRLTDDDTDALSALELGASTRTLSTGDMLCLIYDGFGKWQETCYADND